MNPNDCREINALVDAQRTGYRYQECKNTEEKGTTIRNNERRRIVLCTFTQKGVRDVQNRKFVAS